MPYTRIAELPPAVRESLTEDEQRLWLDVFNRVYAQTRNDEKSSMAAWGAVHKTQVKAILGLKSAAPRVVGWGLLFDDGGDKDLHRTFFDEATRTLLDHYQDAPLFYEHGADPAYGTSVIGRRALVQVYPHGVWAEHELLPDHPQFLRTRQEVEAGLLAYSSDTMGHLIQQEYNPVSGELAFWPIAAWSLVAQPAEPGLGPVSLRQFAAAIEAAKSSRGRGRESDKPRTMPGIARDALAGMGSKSYDTSKSGMSTKGEYPMEELLQLLAQFFGVEPTSDAVLPLLDEFVTYLRGGEGTAEEQANAFAALDLSAIKAALELAEDADNEALAAAFEGFKTTLTPPQRDYGLLKQAAAAHAAAAKAAPAGGDPLPHRTGNGAAHAGKSRRGAPMINRGVPEPGIADLVLAMLERNDRKIAAASKAVGVSSNVAGAYQVRREISTDILAQLEEQEVVMAAGAQVERMDGIETLTVWKDLSTITAYWAAEHQTVSQSDIAQRPVSLSLKELVAEVRVSRRKLRASAPDFEKWLRNEIVKKMRLRLDRSFLLGIGAKPNETGHSGAEPLGLVNVPGINSISLGTNGKYPEFGDLGKFSKALKADNVEVTDTWGWMTHGSLVEDINDLTDVGGNPFMRENWAGRERPTWRGYAYYDTNQLPTNLTAGTSSDCTYLILGDWQYAVVGMGQDVEIGVSDQVYFRERDVLIQAVALVDFGVWYPEAFAVTSGARIRA